MLWCLGTGNASHTPRQQLNPLGLMHPNGHACVQSVPVHVSIQLKVLVGRIAVAWPRVYIIRKFYNNLLFSVLMVVVVDYGLCKFCIEGTCIDVKWLT